MSNKQEQGASISPLLPFGLGVGAGLCGIWAAIELLPLLAMGGVGYLVYLGLAQTKGANKEEAKKCNTGTAKK